MSSSSKIPLNKLLAQLFVDFTDVNFKLSSKFYWSSRSKTIYYKPLKTGPEAYSLLHELGHSQLGHQNFASDFELLRMEAEAWSWAEEMAKQYKLVIPKKHIEDSLDTYRDWLYMRSLCPTCRLQGSQKDPKTYRCFNCGTTWGVTNHRFTRPYRKLNKTKTA